MKRRWATVPRAGDDQKVTLKWLFPPWANWPLKGSKVTQKWLFGSFPGPSSHFWVTFEPLRPKVGKVTLKSLFGHFHDLGASGSVGASADHKELWRNKRFWIYIFFEKGPVLIPSQNRGAAALVSPPCYSCQLFGVWLCSGGHSLQHPFLTRSYHTHVMSQLFMLAASLRRRGTSATDPQTPKITKVRATLNG